MAWRRNARTQHMCDRVNRVLHGDGMNAISLLLGPHVCGKPLCVPACSGGAHLALPLPLRIIHSATYGPV